jgi:hypothetical protein
VTPGRGLVAAALACIVAVPALADPDVVLLGPEVYKLDWNTRNLVAHDMDGDGRTDLLLANNDRARIDLLYQVKPGKATRPARASSAKRWEPVLEDGRFRKRSIVTGSSMYALAAGDLDGDGRVDVAVTGKPTPLTVLYQGKGDHWGRRLELEIDAPAQWTGSLIARDLDGDGRDDLAALSQTAVLLFHQSDEGLLEGPTEYALADEGGYGLTAEDVNGDGRLDLTYLVAQSQHALRVRLQNGNGAFGPERSFRLETPASRLRPVADESGTAFATLARRTRQLELLALRGAAEDAANLAADLRPRVFSTGSAGGQASSYALGDLDGDGGVDLAVGTARSAVVQVCLRRPDGDFREPTAYPSLPDVRSLASADLDGDGRAELLVVSPAEATLGVAALTEQGRLAYPRPLPTTGKPLAVAAEDLDGDRRPEVIYLYEEQGQRGAAILGTDDGGLSWSERRVTIEGLRTDPNGLRVLDANQDGRPDLAVFVLQSPMRILLQDAEGGFAEPAGFRPGLVDNLRSSALSLGDLDGDGKPELVVAGKGFARSLRVTPDGALEVLDQFNARESGTPIAAVAVVDLDGDGTPELLMAEVGGDALQLLRRDRQGVYRYERAIPVGTIDLVGTQVRRSSATGAPELLFLGKDRFWWIPVETPDLGITRLAAHETELEEMQYVDLAVGDLNTDGRPEIALVDSTNTRLLEILTPADEAGWRSALHFTIFEDNPHYEGRRGANREPRELLICDLTADGRQDLALLIHDRVLLYPQQAAGTPP